MCLLACHRLTSYVLRVFNDANEKDWELDFYIEVDLLNRMMLWVCKQQDTATGAFVEHAPAYDRKMWVSIRTWFFHFHLKNAGLKYF